MDLDSGPKVMGDDGEFHATDEAVTFDDVPFRRGSPCCCSGRWPPLCSRSSSPVMCSMIPRRGPKEIARYLLIGTVFVGAAIGVAKNNHIQVDLLYRCRAAQPVRCRHLLM